MTTPQLEKAYELGFLEAARWASRDDLRHDITSPAYLTQRDHDLAALATQAQGQDAAPAEFVKFICVDCTGCEKCRPATRAKE